MDTEADLKKQLQAVRQDKYRLPSSVDHFDIALNMVDHIGSTDSELRDELIYGTFAVWILEQKLFSNEQLHQLLDLALDHQHMFYKIGEKESESVFTRSFSVLLLPLILIANQDKSFLSQEDIQIVKTKLVQYLHEEQDLRGYVKGSGWAHAVAHVADAFDDLAQCPELNAADLLDILNAISAKLTLGNVPYIFEEDERMTTAVIAVLKRQELGETDVENWIKALVVHAQETTMEGANYKHFNVKTFLRSLYFRLRQEKMSDNLIQTVSEALDEISHFND